MNPNSPLKKLKDLFWLLPIIPRFILIRPTNQNRLKVDKGSISKYDLTRAFDGFGSDKGTFHGYGEIYSCVLNEFRGGVSAVLEIGIGSNDSNVPSNMGEQGKPGASLRVWQDFFPNADVYGADIDPKTMFRESRIQTLLVDQLSLKSLKGLKRSLPKAIDLIVIDGLHTPRADVASTITFLPTLPIHGNLFLEDVGTRARILWKFVFLILPSNFHGVLIKTRGGQGTLIHIVRNF